MNAIPPQKGNSKIVLNAATANHGVLVDGRDHIFQQSLLSGFFDLSAIGDSTRCCTIQLRPWL
jgi:hypothetical protein